MCWIRMWLLIGGDAIDKHDDSPHNAKSAIYENNGLTIGEQMNAIQNFITHC